MSIPIEDGYETNCCQSAVLTIQKGIAEQYERHSKLLWNLIYGTTFIAFLAYVGYAMYFRFGDEGSIRLLGFTLFVLFVMTLSTLYSHNEAKVDQWFVDAYTNNAKTVDRILNIFSWCLSIGVFVGVTIYVIIDVAIPHPGNLISVAGLCLYLFIFFITSVNPARVNWHTVYWGIALQYIFALMILRTQWGYDLFKWLGDRVEEFLEHTMAGIVFVFGEAWTQHFFAMKVLSIVVFFFTFINILYYLGAMQAIIRVFGRFLAFCMGTTPAESINAAANIFCSMTESPVTIRPFLVNMTKSELHAVMTGGFSTIAGSVLGAYIAYGIPASHLLSASVMSAPAALAISKLSYPETEKSKASSKDYANLERGSDSSLIEAATNGATYSIKICGSIAVNVLAFLSLLSFLNATLTWLGDRVGVDGLTFELICSYVLYPVAYFMGVAPGDCSKVAELVGIKTFTNEFIAYGNLKVLIENRHIFNNYTAYYNTTSDWYWNNGDVVLNITNTVLPGGFIAEKSEIIATYALCGFANFGAIGIQLGGLTILAPSRKHDLSGMILRAMICGNVACFLTGCIAGLLYKPF